MIVEDTFISGLKLLYLNEFNDIRGSFIKVFNKELFKEHRLETNFKESYFSVSAKNVIRGMHFQIPPAQHTKLVYLNSGKILDVVLDLRQSSPTFGQHFSVEITKDNPFMVYIPAGCAHGFLSLEDNSMVTYMQTSCYNSECDKGIDYNSFGMNWKIESPVISFRDSNFPTFKTFKSPF